MKLKLGTGLLIAVPIPKEHSASGSFVESAIQKALTEARLDINFRHMLFSFIVAGSSSNSAHVSLFQGAKHKGQC